MKNLDLKKIKIQNCFWEEKQTLIKNVVIPFQEKVMNDEIPDVEKSHALANFRIAAGLEEGEHYGMVFQDTDVAKWLEGVAYSLAVKPDLELEKRADEIIDIIEKAQEDNGYLNTYFTVKEPHRKWQNLLECHELYTSGHMMEAAVAYYNATGKSKFLEVMERNAAHIDNRFGYDKIQGIPGHQEIEIGLMRLYHTTGKEKYLNLAKYFLDYRGTNANFFVEEASKKDWKYFPMIPEDTKYNQSDLPVRELSVATGHSVRALYMYTAMADLANETNDKELIAACERLWENLTEKQMYVTGGLGSTVHGEAFTIDYDLPNDTVYAETCASIAMVFFAKQMLDINPLGKYADIMELEMYNGVMSGIQLDGKKFFYVNPLEINPNISGVLQEYKHVLPERPGWYFCACCPPNLVRMVMSLGNYAWAEKDDTIFSHMIMGGEADLTNAKISVESNYPWEPSATYTINPKTDNNFTFALHIPSHCKNTKVYLNKELFNLDNNVKNGYLYITRKWSSNDLLELTFDMPVRRIYCNSNVRENVGKVSLMRGPIVYALEGVDNEYPLQELWLPRTSSFDVYDLKDNVLNSIKTIEFDGLHIYSNEKLYGEEPPIIEKTKIKAIPYYSWGNRGLNQMRVWINETNL